MTDRSSARWRFAALAALVALLWACQDCPLVAVRVGALVVYVVGVTAVVPSLPTALAFAGLTALGGGVFLLLAVVAHVPLAGTLTGLLLAVVLLLGSRSAADRSGRGRRTGRRSL